MYVILHKVQQIRLGQVIANEDDIPPTLRYLPKKSIKIIWIGFLNFLKKYGHIAILIALKYWIKLSYFLKRSIDNLKLKIRLLINKYKKPKDENADSAPSGFLKMITDYKKKLKKIKNKMKEEEKNG
ncbi:MAG: hypothetical protein US50_C0010G0002 [Candidatus Nomurabacteria bacterium GW2011_GWB1_37_5]|uniref:Uncharacterized protein n=1 Tax=Candidatus Nomurabacteria bacterium GW2011_GWB1_37_5 TaxID=1618742 RepID=A0A0G0JFU9_9BACT|nr:MAG: hypothetical protein US50_C0010G0002 [Candidatus Nomurabacteria bacterium GW2011_GWB1_37_5]